MSSAAPRLLDDAEITRQLLDLPGVVRGVAGALTLAVRAPSFEEAVQLVRLVAKDAELMNHHPDIDLRWCTVTFTLSTHSARGVTQLDIELAHQILQSAMAVGAVTLPAPHRVEVALDVADVDAVRPFWTAALGYVERQGDEAIELVAGDGQGPSLWFQTTAADDPRLAIRSRFHLDIHVPAEAVSARLQACLDAGGRLVSDAHAPAWWVLADPEGNEACLCTWPAPSTSTP